LSKDDDNNNNVIQFPTGKKFQISNDDIDRLTEEVNYQKQEVEFIETLIDDIAVDLIRRLVDGGCDISKPHFYGDIALITEICRGLIYRDMGKKHIAQVLIDKIIDVRDDNGQVQPIINYGNVLESKDMQQKELDFGDEGKEIHFEPDFEIPLPEEDDDK
jgi:hypothetical protein